MKLELRHPAVWGAFIVASTLSVAYSAGAQAPPVKVRVTGFDDSGGVRAREDKQQFSDDTEREYYRLKTKLCVRFGIDPGMTSIEPPSTGSQPSESQPKNDAPVATPSEPQRSFLSAERTEKGGTLLRYSDGSTLELRPEFTTETLPNGTKIETLPEGTKIVRWPNGTGVIRNPDGTGANIQADGSIVETDGTIEVLPGGVIRQTLDDDGVVLERYPDGTVRSRPDLVRPGKQTSSTMGPIRDNPTIVPQRQDSLTTVQQNQNCEALLAAVLQADARTAGVPKPLREMAQVEQKAPGLWEHVLPVLIPSISIGIGPGNHRERRHPYERR